MPEKFTFEEHERRIRAILEANLHKLLEVGQPSAPPTQPKFPRFRELIRRRPKPLFESPLREIPFEEQ